MKPKVPGRAAFTGRGGEGVWDFLSLWPDADKQTDYPHLSLGMNAQAVSVLVIVPNRVRIRRNIMELKKEGFEELAGKIVKKMTLLLRKHPEVTPWFESLQRRWPALKAIPCVDATIGFDLRTAGEASEGPKPQLRWLEAVTFVHRQKGIELRNLARGRLSIRPVSRAVSPQGGNRSHRRGMACVAPLVDLLRE